MKREGFVNMFKLVSIMLNVCYDERDAYTTRKLIVLLTTFYTIIHPEE